MPLSAQRSTATQEEIELVAAIRGGDERAFTTAVDTYYACMLAVATAYVLAAESAREIVHQAWVSALGDTEQFDGGVPLRPWLLGFVVRLAAPVAAGPDRPDPGSADPAAPAVGPERFRGGRDGFPGHWRAYPRDWRAIPEDVLRGAETRRVVEAALGAMPVEQRAIIAMRDIAGCPADEACDLLELSDTVARERLHQARCRVRAALEQHFDG